MSSHSTETDAEFDARYEAYFNRLPLALETSIQILLQFV